MNTSKLDGWFKAPTERHHIIGAGSVGSAVAVLLAKSGVKNITIWDFDRVEPKNVVNQMFTEKHIGMPKVEALGEMLREINPDIDASLRLKNAPWDGQELSGYIFMCCDGIELRRAIVERHTACPDVKAVFDFRTMLTGAQHFAADWLVSKDKDNLLATMDYSHEEAVESAPVSACGITLGVCTTVWAICSLGVSNYINFVKGNPLKKVIFMDAFNMTVDAF